MSNNNQHQKDVADNSNPAMDVSMNPSLGGLLDFDLTGDGYNVGSNNNNNGIGGTFPFPLADQASLFNFHTPLGMNGLDPRMQTQSPIDMSGFGEAFGSDINVTTSIAPPPLQVSTAPANSGTQDDLSMDIALLDSVARADPMAYAAATSMIPPTSANGGETDAQMAARVRAARSRILNNVLNGMNFGNIQQIDGFRNGSLADIIDPTSNMPLLSQPIQTSAAAAANNRPPPLAINPTSMDRFLADAASSASLMSGIQPHSANAAVFPFQPLLSPMSQIGGSPGATQPSVASAQQPPKSATGTAPRIDQACKMCRRRKVRCDGLRPTCSFCRTKGFECIYEPVAPGSRKRVRKSRASDAGTSVNSISNVDSASVGDFDPRLLPAIQSAPSSDSDSDDSRKRRLGGNGKLDVPYEDTPEQSGAEDDDSEEGVGKLSALSNHQIVAIPDSILGAAGKLTAKEVKAAAAAAAALKEEADNTMAAATALVSIASEETERSLHLYFEYFHPQHPILHRTTFENAVRNKKTSCILWLAVQAIAARYEKSSRMKTSAVGASDASSPRHPFEYGRKFAEKARSLLPEATCGASIELIQATYLLSEHQFGCGDWLGGSTLWGTAVRMFNQLNLHMTDEAFQFPAYTSHLGLHESAISPVTCRQSPAQYAGAMRRPALNNDTWIAREQERRMRWALIESERMHALAGGTPPLVTLDAGWVHMPCSDSIWEMARPRRAAEYERLLLHMGKYYVDTGGSLRVDVENNKSSVATTAVNSNAGQTATPSTSSSTPSGQQQQPQPNRVASMLVGVRRRKNRIHLNAHTALVIAQMTRARLSLFRLFFPSRWPSQLFTQPDEGPTVLGWDERIRRLRTTVDDIDAKLSQWRVYLESLYPLRERDEGSGKSAAESKAINLERIEYANYRFLLAALLIQNRSTVLQLQACLTRRERRIRRADADADRMDPTARSTLANHVLPNQPAPAEMRALRQFGDECWSVAVRQACEIADLLESHWMVRPHTRPDLRVMVKPDWHARNAIKARINADTNLRKFPEDSESGERAVSDDVTVYFSHETPPYPLLVVNHRLIDAVVKAAEIRRDNPGAELALAASMNSNIHIETNANARDVGMPAALLAGGGRRKKSIQSQNRKPSGSNMAPPPNTATGGRRGPRINLQPSGEVDFESDSEAIDPDVDLDPFRLQHTNTSYFLFLAAKTLIMYLHHAKMSAYILARRRHGGSTNGSEGILPSSSVSADSDLDPVPAEACDDLAPPPQLRTLSDIRRIQDRLEVVLTALRHSQKRWMSVDYFVLCARKLRNMSIYGPWKNEDPVSTDISAELANEPWPPGGGGGGGGGVQ